MTYNDPPSNTNGTPPLKMNEPSKPPLMKNTERMMTVICIAFVVIILAWKAPALSKIYESTDIINSLYSYAPLQDIFTRHPGYLCSYFATQNGGNKSIDVYICKLPEASVNTDTPVIYVFAQKGVITDHIIESNDQKYRLIIDQAQK